MILYQLRCQHDHHFEGWFKDSAAYDAQATAHHIACPYCGDVHIEKAPMAPKLAKSAPGDWADADKRAREVAEQLLESVEQVRDFAEKNFDNVGDQFADEARKIHYGEAEERGIYGSTTDDEARELAEEGVEFFRLPEKGKPN